MIYCIPYQSRVPCCANVRVSSLWSPITWPLLQDEPNPVLWIATQASKVPLSCPLGITPCVLQMKEKNFGVDSVVSYNNYLFGVSMDLNFVLFHKHAKQTEWYTTYSVRWPHPWSIPNPYSVCTYGSFNWRLIHPFCVRETKNEREKKNGRRKEKMKKKIYRYTVNSFCMPTKYILYYLCTSYMQVVFLA